MLTQAQIDRGRRKLAVFLNSSGQVQEEQQVKDDANYITPTWVNFGDAFACCLYSPKGSEIPEPLALLNRTVYWLAGDYPDGTTASHRVLVDGLEYEIHDVPSERTNQFYPRMLVSRLK